MARIMRIDEFLKGRGNFRFKSENKEEMEIRLNKFIEYCENNGWEVETNIIGNPNILYVHLRKDVKSIPIPNEKFSIEVEIGNDIDFPIYYRVDAALEDWIDGGGMTTMEDVARFWWESEYKDKGIDYEDVLNAHKEFVSMVEELIKNLKEEDI